MSYNPDKSVVSRIECEGLDVDQFMVTYQS